jgi:predicted Zn-dependent protease
MTGRLVAGFAVAGMLAGAPAFAQLGGFGKAIDKVQKAADAVDSLTFTDAEERQLGTEISAKLRDRFGVVQDREVHKYVTLVGRVLAANSTRPNLQWTFVVLDTDGVNAFAAPGGFVHITKVRWR